MIQRSGKFSRGPCEVWGEDEPTAGVPALEIGRGEFGTPSCKSICYVNSTLDAAADKFSLTPEDRANASLSVAAFNAATAAEDMGYDGQAAVEALPKLLEMLAVAELLLSGNRSARDNNNFAAEIHEALASCRAKESST